jgi:hypothetical protein
LARISCDERAFLASVNCSTDRRTATLCCECHHARGPRMRPAISLPSLGKRSRRGPLLFLQRREQRTACRASARASSSPREARGRRYACDRRQGYARVGPGAVAVPTLDERSLTGGIATITPSGCCT